MATLAIPYIWDTATETWSDPLNSSGVLGLCGFNGTYDGTLADCISYQNARRTSSQLASGSIYHAGATTSPGTAGFLYGTELKFLVPDVGDFVQSGFSSNVIPSVIPFDPETSLEDFFDDSMTADENKIQPFFDFDLENNEIPDHETEVSGDPEFSVSAETSTQTNPDGSTSTTTTNTTFNADYAGDIVTITENTTIISPDGTVTETTNEPENTTTEETEPDEQFFLDYQTSTFPEVPDFYEQQFEDGMQGVWDSNKDDFESTSLLSLITQLTTAPNSGSCPSWNINMNVHSLANFGSFDLAPDCSIWTYIKVILLVSTMFAIRFTIFGG